MKKKIDLAPKSDTHVLVGVYSTDEMCYNCNHITINAGQFNRIAFNTAFSPDQLMPFMDNIDNVIKFLQEARGVFAKEGIKRAEEFIAKKVESNDKEYLVRVAKLKKENAAMIKALKK